MDIPVWIVWIVIIIVFSYTVGFSIILWQEKNKVGSITIFLLAIAIVVAPFFSVLK